MSQMQRMGSPIYRQKHMLWEFTHGNHVGGLLELHCLMVDEATFGVDDHVGVHWTIFSLALGGGANKVR
jgi:hypothetical protein